uniref:NAD(P)-binding domain-containing protein n=1 Tax=Oryza rufipogon TaxID=4529 RepID=A0A0E0NWF6_ORYRU
MPPPTALLPGRSAAPRPPPPPPPPPQLASAARLSRRPLFNAATAVVVRSRSKDEASFTDRILDYIEGGPKLRRWYGAPDLLPKDGSAEDEEDEPSDIEEPRDAVLVTNGDSEIGQMVILSLILKRARIKALVKDRRSTEEAFGTYVECMVGNMEDKSFTKKALRGVRAIICPADDGFFSDLDLKGVQHIVLLSQLRFNHQPYEILIRMQLSVYRGSGGLQAIMNSKLRKLAERDEEVVLASGIPSTIIRTGSMQSTPGGDRGFDFTEGAAAKGRMSKEDAATICVEALDSIPQTTLIFEVANGDEKVTDWKAWFAERTKTATS